jgi:hypothetical protein
MNDLPFSEVISFVGVGSVQMHLKYDGLVLVGLNSGYAPPLLLQGGDEAPRRQHCTSGRDVG